MIINFFDYIADLKVGDFQLISMVWNYLLLIPAFLFGYYLNKIQKEELKKITKVFLALTLFIFWLIFVPNSFYIIYDIRHLATECFSITLFNVCPKDAWHILFFYIYSFGGWFFSVYFLNQVMIFFKNIFNESIGNFFIIILMPFMSLGILLGLIDRWNSWDLIVNPMSILSDSIKYFVNFVYIKNLFLNTMFLYILYYLGNFLFRKEIILWKTKS